MKWQIAFAVALAIVLMTAFRAYGAPPRSVGVNVDDWANYSVTYEGNATFIGIGGVGDEANMTVVTFTVLDISRTNVTMEAHEYYLNGSETVETGWIDVDTGQSGGNASAGTLIAANLAEGDLVYTTAVEPFMGGTINETVARDYLGAPAVVNHFVRNESSPPNPFFNVSMSMDWYWYKATGVPAEITINYTDETAPLLMPGNYIEQAESNMTWFVWRMTISSIVPEFPAVNVVPVLMIATLLIVLVSVRRARSPRWIRV